MSDVTLFSPLSVGSIDVPNRIFMAPLTRNRAPDRVPNELMLQYYVQRAGAGLIISEATQISELGHGYPATPGIHTPEQIRGWKRITDAVHGAGGRIVLQLWHTGRVSSEWKEGDPLRLSPSGVPMASSPAKSRALELEEIPGVVGQYVRGAENAIAAGFDGVEVHGANGYLIDQFTRDGTNRRTDRYGGSLENRLRFAMEVASGVARSIGADRVGYRISPSSTFNDMTDSTPFETFGALAEQLGALKLAYLHVIEENAKDKKHGGLQHVGVSASFFRNKFPGVLVANGGYNQQAAETALAGNEADAIAFGTAFLANPDLPARFRTRAALNIPEPATFYGGDHRGYIDYPALEPVSA